MNNIHLTLDKTEWIKCALIGAAISAILSYMVNYFIVGMPVTAVGNAANNAVSGAISALLTGLVGTFVYLKALQKNNPGKNQFLRGKKNGKQSIRY